MCSRSPSNQPHAGTQYHDPSYWLQEQLQINTFPDNSTVNTYYNEDANASNNVPPQQYDFLPLGGELFQPEEIFQLDQPLKSQEYAPILHSQNSEIARSPPMLLDLGSGTIHRSPIKPEPESVPYWMLPQQTVTTDESNSSSICSPDATNIVAPMENYMECAVPPPQYGPTAENDRLKLPSNIEYYPAQPALETSYQYEMGDGSTKTDPTPRFGCDSRVHAKETGFSETETPMGDINVHYEYPLTMYCTDTPQDPLSDFRLHCDDGYHSTTQFPHFQHWTL